MLRSLPLLPVLLLAACATTKGDKSAAAPTDPQIAQIAVTANQIDIDNGKLALERSKNPEVRQFAERMIADHEAVNQQAVDLVTRLGVTPEESDTSRSLKASNDEARNKLAALDEASFDKAYVDGEVAYHQAVIATVEDTLIPNAQNAELKALLEQVDPALKAHLEHAKQLQSSLGAKP